MGKHAFNKPSGVRKGISFKECTARSTLFSSISFSISFTNRSFCIAFFILAKSFKFLSPLVVMTSRFTFNGKFLSNPFIPLKSFFFLNSSYFSVSIFFTFFACTRARILPLVPIVISFISIYFHNSFCNFLCMAVITDVLAILILSFRNN